MKNYGKMIEALQLARILIETGSDDYVCYALDEVALRRKDLEESSSLVRVWIGSSISGYSTVWLWGTDTGAIPNHIASASHLMREYRLAWIDDMIRVLKGD